MPLPLPDELISHVFLLGCPTLDDIWSFADTENVISHRRYLFTLRSVSRLWDLITLSTPALWTLCYWGELDWSASDVLLPLQLHLARSGALPISVYLGGPEEVDLVLGTSLQVNCDALSSLRAENASRIYALAVRHPSPLACNWPLAKPLTSLRHMSVTLEWAVLIDFGPAPVLESLSITELVGLSASFLFRQLQATKLKRLELTWAHYGEYEETLLGCQELETLHLNSCAFHQATFYPNSAKKISFRGDVPQFLESSRIYSASVENLSVDLSEFPLSSLDIPRPLAPFTSLRRLTLHLDGGEHDSSAFTMLLASSPSLLHVHLHLVALNSVLGVRAFLYPLIVAREPDDPSPSGSSSIDPYDPSELRAPNLSFLRISLAHSTSKLDALYALESLFLLRPRLQVELTRESFSNPEDIEQLYSLAQRKPHCFQMTEVPSA